jgi:hypothetical protein
MTTTGKWRLAIAALVGLALAAGCDKKDDQPATAPLPAATPAPATASAPAASSAAQSTPPSGAMVVKYKVDPAGKTSIDMPAPKEHIKADTTAAGGDLQIDLMNLTSSRGEVKVDLTTLKTHTFGDSKDEKQTEHALNWLEVGNLVTPEVKEKNRWATLTIRSVEGAMPTDLSKATPEKTADGEVRAVTLSVHGDFLLHGHKVEKVVALDVRFHYPAGAPADAKPTSLDVTNKMPLHVVLADHEVKPRDNLGSLAQNALGLLGTKVAETADVTLDLHATLAP